MVNRKNFGNLAHFKWNDPIGKNLGKFGGPQLPYQKSQKTSGPGRHPFGPSTTSFCDVTPGLYAGHRKVRFRGFI